MPTFVDIAGGAKGDGLKKQIEAGSYPGIVKTTLDGVDQRDYLEGKSEKSARDTFFYYSGRATVGRALQELEDLLHDGVRRPGRLHRRRTAVSLGAGRQYQARSVRDIRRRADQDADRHGRRTCSPSTAYVYDWNMLPIGQALWLKELETYVKFPPMQDPASYNLEQVVQQVKNQRSARSE